MPKLKNNLNIFIYIFPLLITTCALLLGLSSCRGKESFPYKKRQIILISIDTLRADHLSVYGYNRNTSPNIDSLTKTSTLYSHAYTNGCWTMPSHMSLLTGTLPSRHGINKDWKTYMIEKKYPVLDDSIKNLAEIFKEKNIPTIKIASLPDELGFGRGFEKNYSIDPFLSEENFHILENELIKNKQNDFFLFIHTWMVHAPYSNSYYLEKKKKGKLGQQKLDYIDHFRNNESNYYKFQNFIQANELYNKNDCVDLYDGGIHYVDEYIGRILKLCKKEMIYNDLLIAIVSDHGEHFGERNENKFYDEHGWDYFEEFIHVPVIIKYPGQSKQKKILKITSLIDLFSTICDYYSFNIPSYVQGNSLLKKSEKKPLISESTAHSSEIEIKMIRVGDLKYMITMTHPVKRGRVNWNGIIERRLFSLKNDPSEHKDLSTNLKYRRVCFELERILKNFITDSVEKNKPNNEIRIKKETYELLKSLGYL